MSLSDININKRRFLQLFAAVPALMSVKVMFNTTKPPLLEDDIVVVNGWVLLKSDLLD